MIHLNINKHSKTRLILAICTYVYFSFPGTLHAQDSIKIDELKKFSYTFDIVDHEFIGDGAEIIHKALANAHVTMLGNNSRDQQEETLDFALTKILNINGYKTMLMEVGPASGTIINRLSEVPSQTVEQLKKLNQKYYFKSGSAQLMPIPDLKYLRTAEMVQYIKEQSWSLTGVGTEAWTSYRMLLDEIYNNLPESKKQLLKTKYQSAAKLIDRLYSEMKGQSYEDILILTNGIRASIDFSILLDQAAEFKINKAIIESLQFSLDYWQMYGNKEFYKKNKLDAQRNKRLLKASFQNQSFDLSQDKVFVKMWRGHLTNGVTSRGFYGIGNTLMELAAYHGNNSLTIGVLGRYKMKDGVNTDILNEGGYISPLHRVFIELGQKDHWVLIDLRAFTEAFNYGNYHTTLALQTMMARFDMILIPKTDSKASLNY